MGVFDKEGVGADGLEAATAPEPETANETAETADNAPTEAELEQAEAEAKEAEEKAAEAEKAKANAERIAKMNAAKAAKKAAEEKTAAAVATTAPAETAPAPKAPESVSKPKLTPEELAELHEETGVKPSKDDIKTEKDMRDYLMAKPKVSVVIPLQPGEKPGTTESVSVNGVILTIKKGVMVSIPKPFADQVMNFTNIQMENGTVGGDFAIEAGSAKAKVLGA